MTPFEREEEVEKETKKEEEEEEEEGEEEKEGEQSIAVKSPVKQRKRAPKKRCEPPERGNDHDEEEAKRIYSYVYTPQNRHMAVPLCCVR